MATASWQTCREHDGMRQLKFRPNRFIGCPTWRPSAILNLTLLFWTIYEVTNVVWIWFFLSFFTRWHMPHSRTIAEACLTAPSWPNGRPKGWDKCSVDLWRLVCFPLIKPPLPSVSQNYDTITYTTLCLACER